MCHMYMSVPGVQKRATDFLEMELQVVGYKLGVKTRSPGRAERLLTGEPSFQTHMLLS